MERLEGVRLQIAAKGSSLGRVAVVLAAVEETIKANGSELTATAYFAALLALLDSSVSGQDVLNHEGAYAAVYLLDLVVSDVPRSLLISKFVQTLNLLVPLLNSSEAATIRSAIGVLASLLSGQSNESWREPATQQSFRSLLLLALDTRPKVRRSAADAVCSVLSHAPAGVTRDSSAAILAADELLKVVSSQIAKDEKAGLLHTLHVIKAIAATIAWPVAHVDRLCDLLLRGVSDLGQGFVTVLAFEVFEKVFDTDSAAIDTDRFEELLASIVAMRPNERDVNVLPPWLNVLGRGYELLAKVAPEKAMTDMLRIYKSILPFLQSDLAPIRQTCGDCLQALIGSCLPTRTSNSVVQGVVTCTLRVLNSGTKYRAARGEIYAVVQALFAKLKSKASPLLLDALPTLATARQNDEDKTQIDAVLGSAVEAIGPRAFLKVLPLGLTSGNGRAWLLPVLRDNVKNTELAYFISELVPLSEQFYEKSLGDDIDAKVYRTIIDQIWSCLPGFCELPLDLKGAFNRDFAELLGNVLYQQPELRPTLCLAMQNLCLLPHHLLASDLTDAEFQVNVQLTRARLQGQLKHLQQFAPNSLSILFNVYSQTVPMSRGYILETIKAFLSVTSEADIRATFAKVLQSLSESVTEPDGVDNARTIPPMKITAMDIVLAFIPYLRGRGLQLVLELTKTHLPGESAQMQKKAYKALNALATTDEGLDLLQTNIGTLEKMLRVARRTHPAARKDRLQALLRTMEILPREDLHFVPGVLPEVVLATKEQNEKSRNLAFEVLVLIGHRMHDGGRVRNSLLPNMQDVPDVDASLQEFLVMLQGGLASTKQHLVSATVAALARVLFEFRAELGVDLVQDLLANMDPILESKDREVARSALGFYKVVVISLPADVVRPRLEALVGHLLGWSHLHARDFKSKVKHLLERMCRRFGFYTIDSYMPEEDKKLLVNIRKTHERRKRRQKEADADGEDVAPRSVAQAGDTFEQAMLDSDMDLSDEGEEASVVQSRSAGRNKRSTAQAKAFILEDIESPMDLLDRSALARVSSTNPQQRAKAQARATMSSTRSKFKVDASSGRYVFDDESADEADQRPSAQQDRRAAPSLGSFLEARKDSKRTARGGVRFSNKRSRDDDDDGDPMDVDQPRPKFSKPEANGRAGRHGGQGPSNARAANDRQDRRQGGKKPEVSATRALFVKDKRQQRGEKAGGRKTRR